MDCVNSPENEPIQDNTTVKPDIPDSRESLVSNLINEVVSRNKSCHVSSTDCPAKKKVKKRSLSRKHSRCSSFDLISWPSDSDITVLRMKFKQNRPHRPENFMKGLLGDGVHLPSSCSMVNLATVINPADNSKLEDSLEHLIPLTSWQRSLDPVRSKTQEDNLEKIKLEQIVMRADYQGSITENEPILQLRNSNSSIISLRQTRSKVARFLRLYFCPCCTWLYEFESRCEGKCHPRSPAYRTY